MQGEDDKIMELRLQIEITNDANETLVCSKILVPTSMRSRYWKYFGFPSDDFNNILTKKKIICALCQSAICYNKNTSNLRTHLVAKHCDIYYQLNEEYNSETMSKKQKTSGTISGSILTKPECSIAESSNNNNHKQSDVVKPSDLNFIEIDNPDNEFVAVHNNEGYDDFHENFEIDEIEEGQQETVNDRQQEQSVNPIKNVELIYLISEMLIKDLLSPKIICGNGFRGLMQQFHNNINEISISDVEKNIQETYNNKFKVISEYIKKKSNESAYCLGLEIFNNCEQKFFLNIYFIFISNDNGYTFKNVFYKTILLTNQINYSQLFYDEKINLTKCAAFILTDVNQTISSFAKEKGIPIMLSLDTLIANVVNSVFQIEYIKTLLTKLTNYLASNEENTIIPDIYEQYAWSKYAFLKYINEPIFYENFLLKSKVCKHLEQIKEIIDLLNPLRLILDTIADETPYSSLIKPLSEQLVAQNYDIKENDTKLEIEIKNVIKKEITEKILQNPFFIEISFLDPRFQHFLNANDRNLMTTTTADKLKILYGEEKPIKVEFEKATVNRKSSLKMFFNQPSQKKNLETKKSVIESELEKYTNEISIDLEYCPITWWDNNGYLYKNLRKYSMKFFSIPCNINNLFKLKIDEEIRLLNNRFLLNEKYINILWFLKLNYDNNFL